MLVSAKIDGGARNNFDAQFFEITIIQELGPVDADNPFDGLGSAPGDQRNFVAKLVDGESTETLLPQGKPFEVLCSLPGKSLLLAVVCSRNEPYVLYGVEIHPIPVVAYRDASTVRFQI